MFQPIRFPGIPNLAAQRAGYIESQLKALKDGTRKNPIMNAMAAQLTGDEIANVAAYFASLPGAPTAAKSELLPNVAKTSVTFPEGYDTSFTKYLSMNFPATKQVRYFYANEKAVKAAKAGEPLPDGSVILGEAYAANFDSDGKPVLRLHRDGARCGMGQGHPRDAPQRELELRGLHAREAAARRGEPGRVPRLPQAAGQGELHLHAEGA